MFLNRSRQPKYFFSHLIHILSFLHNKSVSIISWKRQHICYTPLKSDIFILPLPGTSNLIQRLPFTIKKQEPVPVHEIIDRKFLHDQRRAFIILASKSCFEPLEKEALL